jgi:hypothetical protein
VLPGGAMLGGPDSDERHRQTSTFPIDASKLASVSRCELDFAVIRLPAYAFCV